MSTGVSLRAGAARLAWGLCSVLALVLAGAVLLRVLRADAGAAPWEQWFWCAEALTPQALADVMVPDLSLLEADAWRDAFGWGLASLAWLVLGLVLALVLRPGRPRAVTTHVRASSGQVAAPGTGEDRPEA